MINSLDAFFDLLADPKTDFRVRLMNYEKINVFEFCRYYAR